nr:unnamed protein product [Callosobruchus chinensis]
MAHVYANNELVDMILVYGECGQDASVAARVPKQIINTLHLTKVSLAKLTEELSSPINSFFITSIMKEEVLDATIALKMSSYCDDGATNAKVYRIVLENQIKHTVVSLTAKQQQTVSIYSNTCSSFLSLKCNMEIVLTHFNPCFRTWDELVVKLKQDFLPYDYEVDLWDEIRNRTQGSLERVVMFVAVMENLFNKLGSNKPSETAITQSELKETNGSAKIKPWATQEPVLQSTLY